MSAEFRGQAAVLHGSESALVGGYGSDRRATFGTILKGFSTLLATATAEMRPGEIREWAGRCTIRLKVVHRARGHAPGRGGYRAVNRPVPGRGRSVSLGC
jgi:hypothetical protein